MSELKEKVFKELEGWFFDIEPTAYSRPTDDGNFIRNVIDEDIGEPENAERIFGPLNYATPLKLEDVSE